MRKRTFILTEKMIEAWKKNALNYLLNLFDAPNHLLQEQLTLPGALTPRHRKKGHYLFQPEGLYFCAYYLQKGLAKLYSVDRDTNKEKIFYFWEAETVIFMNSEFWKMLPKGDYYIELMEDAEVIAINNIYNERKACYLDLINLFRLDMKERLFYQLNILLVYTKPERVGLFEQYFPGLRGRLTQEEIHAFIGVSPTSGRRAD